MTAHRPSVCTPYDRPRPVSTPVNTSVQIPKVGFEIQPVLLPRYAVHPGSRVRTDRPVRLPQAVDGHVMKKRGEPHLLVLTRHPAHAIQIT